MRFNLYPAFGFIIFMILLTLLAFTGFDMNLLFVLALLGIMFLIGLIVLYGLPVGKVVYAWAKEKVVGWFHF